MSENKNFGLAQEEFDRMVQSLQGGDESLFEHIFLSQFKQTNIRLSRSLNIDEAKAYDVCMETLLLMRKKLIEGKLQYGNLNFIFFQMGKQIHIQQLRKKERVVRAEETSSLKFSDDGGSNKEAMLHLMNQVWTQLSLQCREILEKFYYDKMSMRNLALELDKSEVAVRKQKQRCIAHMKTRLSSLIYRHE